jgi:hypothetical protein
MQDERHRFARRALRALALSMIVGTGLAASVAIGSASTSGTAATTGTTTTATTGTTGTTTGTTTTTSNAPANLDVPSISGTPQDGAILTADPGAWSNNPSSYTYAWLRCDANGANCVPIAGATSQRYTVTSADVGHTLRVDVTASNASGSGTASSHPSAVVTAAGAAPASSAVPGVTGTAQEGQTLTAGNGTWTGTAPITFTYQWQRCDAAGGNCASIAGATGQTYKLTSADVGHTVRVSVTGKNARGSSTASSNPTAVVTPAKTTQGATRLNVADVALPDRLIVDRIQYSANPVRSRAPFTARFHVVDTKGLPIQGALVYTVGLPYYYLQKAPEVATDANGWATMTLQPTARMPLHRGGAIVMFVRARKPGDNLLAGVSTRRLVQVRVAPR